MNTAITRSATIKETAKPVARTPAWWASILYPCFMRVYADAAHIVGTARKKENSAATSRDVPRRMAPIIVAAERDVPGTIARHWINPINTAVL